MGSKRYEQALTLVDPSKTYPLAEAVAVLKEFPAAKFNETVELSASLDIDSKKTDQLIRGTVILPHGTGQSKTVLVFCKGEQELIAKQAGADYVGLNDLIEKIQGGWLGFDVAVATPDLMREVSKLGKVLGPRGLMPSPKVGPSPTTWRRPSARSSRARSNSRWTSSPTSMWSSASVRLRPLSWWTTRPCC